MTYQITTDGMDPGQLMEAVQALLVIWQAEDARPRTSIAQELEASLLRTEALNAPQCQPAPSSPP